MKPEIHIKSAETSVEESVVKIMAYLREQGLVVV